MVRAGTSRYELLTTVDEYFDAAPRRDADAEEVGPFTLFRGRSTWPYYARPSLGQTDLITAWDIGALSERCAAVEVDLAIEWIEELTPSLADAAESFGLSLERHALLIAAPGVRIALPEPLPVRAEILAAGDRRLLAAHSVAEVAFGSSGTATGTDGVAARDDRQSRQDEAQTSAVMGRAESGHTVTAVIDEPGDGVVAAAQLQATGTMAEVLAVGTLPTHRRRGYAAAVTAALVAHARAHGVDTVLLSAEDADVARVYERIGFVRIGTHVAAR